MATWPVALAASLLRFLDPYTCVWQTDDAREGSRIASEAGYWPVPNGLADPLAKSPRPRTIHCVFRTGEKPFPGYDPAKPSPLFKINQVGYRPDGPKFAYAGAWLGPRLGAWRPKSPMAEWRLADAATGETVLAASAPVLRVKDGVTKEGAPCTGEETYEMDFSSVTNEGVYYVEIPGVGRSANFRIASSAAEEAFRVHMGGLYQKRCGIAKTEPYTHWTAGACHTDVVRGIFPPEEGKLEPKVKWFEIIRDSTDWERGERLNLAGGWHDAADYDRRPAHFSVVNDLCAVYLMRPGNFGDGQLSIPENRNGIPDILDEAEWGLRHLIAGQQPDGGVGTWIETTAHPGPGSDAARDTMRYALSRATRGSSLAYAAHAALLARCRPEFREKYLASAIRAWNFATTARPGREVYEIRHTKGGAAGTSEIVYWDEDRDLPSAALVKAAVNLHALTGDGRYLSPLVAAMPRLLGDVQRNAWKWPPLSFSGELAAGAPPPVLAEFFKRWRDRTLNTAKDIRRQTESAYAYRAPWWAPGKGWANAMSWGQCHPLRRAQFFVAAHGFTGDASWIDAASLANDFHNGCNPQGTTLTSGLGTVYPVAFLDLPSYVDGIAEYVPGITPYRWNYGLPAKVVEMVFGGDKALADKWPVWRRFGNLENQTVAASEYTVWETIAPAASVTGYLLMPSGKPPETRPAPAKDIRDLAGYWVLP